MRKRISSFLFLTSILIIGYVNKDVLLYWMREGGVLSIFISILAVAIGAVFPIVPFPILGGVIGAVFGVWRGACISLTGGMIGTIVMFFLVRYGFRDLAQTYLNKHKKMKSFEARVVSNSFLVVCFSRMIPIIPAAVVNIVWALSKVNWVTFFFASAIGKIPNILLVNFAGANFLQHKEMSLLIYLAYVVTLAIMNYVVYVKKRKLVKNMK